jgi:hypothetical protein
MSAEIIPFRIASSYRGDNRNEFDTSLLNGRMAECRGCKSLVVSSTDLRHFRYCGPGSFFECDHGYARKTDAFDCGCQKIGGVL